MPRQKRIRGPHQVLASTSRAAVLDLLRRSTEPLGVEDVAREVGLHANTVRAHLDVLADSGYAVRRTLPPSGPGRPRTVYEATTAPDDGSNYRLLAEMLTRYLVETSDRPGEAAVRAGRQWSAPRVQQGLVHGVTVEMAPELHRTTPAAEPVSEQVALAEVMRLLADSGFAPELSDDRSRIDLHHCPFLDLAVAHPDVVCGAHLGLLQGALDEMNAPVSATRLLPLVQPNLCVAHLEHRQPSDPPVSTAS